MIPNDTKWYQMMPSCTSYRVQMNQFKDWNRNPLRNYSDSKHEPSTPSIEFLQPTVDKWAKMKEGPPTFPLSFCSFRLALVDFWFVFFFLVPLSRHSQWSPSPKRPRPTNRWGDPTSRPSSASLLKYFSLSLFLSLWWACFITSLSVSQTLKKKIGPGTRLGWQKPTVHLVLALVFFFNGNPEPRRSSFHCELQLTLIGLLAFHSFALLLFFES